MFGDKKYLISEEKVEQVVYTDNHKWLIIDDISIKEIYSLNSKLRELGCEIDGTKDMKKFLVNVGYPAFFVEHSDEVEKFKDIVAFDMVGQRFFNLKDCKHEFMYKFHNGTSWVKEFVKHKPEIITISSESVNLDDWDDYNWQMADSPYHKRVYRTCEIDGEEKEDTFLVVYSTPWQDDHPTGAIMNIDKLTDYLSKMNRELKDYIPKIKKL